MTHIHFERTGGFMGRKVTLDLDLDELPDEQSEAIQALLDLADFFALPRNLVERAVPDAFTYSITVDKGFARKHSVVVSDSSAPDALRPLLDELSQLARGKH